MPGTYSNLLYHLVFSTKGRANLIAQNIEPRLHEFLGGIVRSERGTAYQIGGTANHVHLLIRWRTDESVATLLRTLKSRSSAWVHETFPVMSGFRWQEGYGAFTVSQSQSDVVNRYISSQEQHHRATTFEEEFVAFLQAHNIQYDERYLWD
jgi:REP element-mobilizing transposase RayT